MADWEFAQRDPSEHLARIQQYSMVKHCGGRDVEFIITVQEYLTPVDPAMKFLARADKHVNQKTAGIIPVGWGVTHLQALSACLEMIRRFPYEGE